MAKELLKVKKDFITREEVCVGLRSKIINHSSEILDLKSKIDNFVFKNDCLSTQNEQRLISLEEYKKENNDLRTRVTSLSISINNLKKEDDTTKIELSTAKIKFAKQKTLAKELLNERDALNIKNNELSSVINKLNTKLITALTIRQQDSASFYTKLQTEIDFISNSASDPTFKTQSRKRENVFDTFLARLKVPKISAPSENASSLSLSANILDKAETEKSTTTNIEISVSEGPSTSGVINDVQTSLQPLNDQHISIQDYNDVVAPHIPMYEAISDSVDESTQEYNLN